MEEIVTEHSGSVLRVQLNRPTKRNAMTTSMYLTLADIFNEAAKDENTRVVQGAAIGGGTTMLTHCDFVYAGESAKFQMPFVNLAVVPEFGSSWSVPAWFGHIRAAELILLGVPFDAKRGAELGLVTQVVSDRDLLATARETARKLAAKPAGALQACKRLMKRPFREQIRAAMKAENEEFSAQVRSGDAKEAFAAFLQKRSPNFTQSRASATAA
jgi:enoyl-CoA hydratase/carnithine racemase